MATENGGERALVEREELDTDKPRGPGVGDCALGEVEETTIESLEKEAEEIEGELRAGAPAQQLLFGEGELTPELLAREVDRSAAFSQCPAGGQLLWPLSEGRAAARNADGSVPLPSMAIRAYLA